MEIKDIKEFFTEENKGKPWEYTHSDIEVMPVDFVKEIAIQYAKQFIDLAAEKADTQMFFKNKNKRWQKIIGTYEFDSLNFEHKTDVNKKSILDIKQLIK